MKKFLKKFVSFIISNNFSLNLFRFINREKLLIIYYHRVVKKEELTDVKVRNMCVDIESFEAQMRFLKEFYNPVGEEEIIPAIEGKGKISEYSVWITFDDGYKDNYENAYHILKKYKIPATFFVTT